MISSYLSEIAVETFSMIDSYIRKCIHETFMFHEDPSYSIFPFLSNLEEFNEDVSSYVPFLKPEISIHAIETALTPKLPGSRRRSSARNYSIVPPFANLSTASLDSEVFEIEPSIPRSTPTPLSRKPSVENSKAIPSPSPKSTSMMEKGWQTVQPQRKQSFPNTSRPSISSSPIGTSSFLNSSSTNVSRSPLPDSEFPKIGQWEYRRPSTSNEGSKVEQWDNRRSSFTNDNFPKIGQWENRRPSSNSDTRPSSNLSSNIAKSLSNSSNRVDQDTLLQGETLSSLIESKSKTLKSGKLSQREKRKIQLSAEKTTPSAQLKNETVNNPWKVESKPKLPDTLESPFAAYQAGPSTLKAVAKDKPSITQIMQQERFEVKQKEIEKTKSLKEIQQEEEFAKWWAEESAKVQREEEFLRQLANPPAKESTGQKRKSSKTSQRKSFNARGNQSNVGEVENKDNYKGNRGGWKGKGRSQGSKVMT